jgi:hypothetical protein
MTANLELKLTAYFKEVDKLRERVNELEKKQDWQGAELHNQLGFSSNPGQQKIKGSVWDKFEQYRELIYGKTGNFGLSTKVDIMWKAHFPIWAVITSGITGSLLYLWNKLIGKG